MTLVDVALSASRHTRRNREESSETKGRNITYELWFNMALQFKLDGIDGQARATTVTLAHGSYTTPVFMPVGTKGCVSP